MRQLVDHGVDLHYVASHNYDALIDAVHGRSLPRDAGLLDLLRYLIDRGVALSRVSSYGESGLSVLSRLGRFDAVALLLETGADAGLLEWAPLHRAAALGTVDEVVELAAAGDDLEATDRWSRTPCLVALSAGAIDKAESLLEAGADPAALGRCGAPALYMPIVSSRPETLAWLLDQPHTQVDQTDEFGRTALIEAVQYDEPECVDLLLKAGARVDHDAHGTPLSHAESHPVVMRLLEAGADPADANQRLVLGMGEPDADALANIAKQDFRRQAKREFGKANPQRMDRPVWEAMIRAGVNAYQAGERFGLDNFEFAGPVWCAERFGQSLTPLPDGRAVQIGGEHEDYYDPDFCIYNDVFVHGPDGQITIYGYPEAVFPPTDFHTATLVGDAIIVIGRLGYAERRDFGSTPVYRLEIDSWQITPVVTRGPSPGWVHRHRAELIAPDEIRVWSGQIAEEVDGQEQHRDNRRAFVLNTASGTWWLDASAEDGIGG